jgi:predicted esterase YcpF (UPF0227 family)
MFIYLHGFNSSGESAKGRYIEQQFGELKVYRPSYPVDPDHAIKFLSHFLDKHIVPGQKTLLIGSSLGGYYAQYLSRQFNTGVVMINPALTPAVTLAPYLGVQTNFYTHEQYNFGQTELNRLLKYDVSHPCDSAVPSLLLLDEGDEVLDYRHALKAYQACGECHCFTGGDHQFRHLDKAVPLIRQFYREKC